MERMECNAKAETAPVKSLVQVLFEGSGCKFAYFNDRFDLQVGDIVFVEGKMEGQRGRVVSVNKTFKIKVSAYKRVISVAQHNVKGSFCLCGSHLISFERNVLPYEKVLTWLAPPTPADEEYVSVSDGETFLLDDLTEMEIDHAVAERGIQYYRKNRVSFLEVDGSSCRAIVEGTHPYEVEFSYEDGEIGNLTCNCFCAYACKHEFAVMLQLQETLGLIKKWYGGRFTETGYFAAVSCSLFFSVATAGQRKGIIEVDIE